jgi:hypothetical protein
MTLDDIIRCRVNNVISDSWFGPTLSSHQYHLGLSLMAPLPPAGGKISNFGPFDSDKHPPKIVMIKKTGSTQILRPREEILGLESFNCLLPPFGVSITRPAFQRVFTLASYRFVFKIEKCDTEQLRAN